MMGFPRTPVVPGKPAVLWQTLWALQWHGIPSGLRCARVRDAGGPQKLTVYVSVEVHSCSQKAVELLGMGSASLRKIPVKDDFTIDLNALEQALADDRAAGSRPICIIGSAGTINTGAVDDLNALADLCQREDLWFHVDGAIGARWLCWQKMLSLNWRALTRGLGGVDLPSGCTFPLKRVASCAI